MKPFTIYFPQFHMTSTNNRAWGYGFDDWALVSYANMTGRWERRAPARGFYSGSSSKVHDAQIDEIKSGGIGGIALYHYWFDGHRELHCLEDRLRGEDLGVPWFSVWANEAWTKRWIGDPTIILDLDQKQNTSLIKTHCEYLIANFESPNYFYIKNRPLFMFYNMGYFSRPEWVIEQYRKEFNRLGYDVKLGQFVKNPADLQNAHYFDINYCFEPRLFFGVKRLARGVKTKVMFDILRRLLPRRNIESLMVLLDSFQQKGNKFRSEVFVEYLKSQERTDLLSNFMCQDVLSPGWNNYPRYGSRFTELQRIDPIAFSNLIHSAAQKSEYPVLINAWNEWSEGAAIEPCYYLGDQYLSALSGRY